MDLKLDSEFYFENGAQAFPLLICASRNGIIICKEQDVQDQIRFNQGLLH